MFKTTLILFLCGLVIPMTSADTEITIESSFGNITGLLNNAVKFGAGSIPGIRFLGIPYAKPPIGDRRFKKPEPETMLQQNPYNASYFRSICVQATEDGLTASVNMSEDCLHLNIFVPGSRIPPENTYPVMIWIYGGGFQNGFANIYYADILSTYNDVIVVTFNYRVGVFGFLDLGGGSERNNGLHDQKLVVDWVQNHIGSFGGNVSSVTIFGESAGGASVVYQALYPGNRNKVHRAISQSGSPLATWAFDINSVNSSKSFAKKVNCDRDSANEMLACLRGKTAQELINHVNQSDVYGPAIDGDFIAMAPSDLIDKYTADTSSSLRSFADIDFLVGFNDKDGAGSIIGLWGPILNAAGYGLDTGVPKAFFESVYVPTTLNYTFGNRSSKALEMAAIHQYIDWHQPDNMVNVRDSMIDMSTDSLFLVPAILLANKHSNISTNSNTYVYQFSHRPPLLPPPWLTGAMHTWELGYMFGLSPVLLIAGGMTPTQLQLIPETDGNLALAMMKYWTNFAKTGNPNNASLQQGGYPTWPQYDMGSAEYIDLNTNLTDNSVKRRPAASRVNFWTKLAPQLTQHCPVKECDDCKSQDTSNGSLAKLDILLAAMFIMFYLHRCTCGF